MLDQSCALLEERLTIGCNHGQNISIFIQDASKSKIAADFMLQILPPPLLPEKASMRMVSTKNSVKLGEVLGPGSGPPKDFMEGSESIKTKFSLISKPMWLRFEALVGLGFNAITPCTLQKYTCRILFLARVKVRMPKRPDCGAAPFL